MGNEISKKNDMGTNIMKVLNSAIFIKSRNIPSVYLNNCAPNIVDPTHPNYLDHIIEILGDMNDYMGTTKNVIESKLFHDTCYLSRKYINNKVMLPCCCNVCDYDELIKIFKQRYCPPATKYAYVECKCTKSYRFKDLIFIFNKLKESHENFDIALDDCDGAKTLAFVDKLNRDQLESRIGSHNICNISRDYLYDYRKNEKSHRDDLIILESLNDFTNDDVKEFLESVSDSLKLIVWESTSLRILKDIIAILLSDDISVDLYVLEE